VRWLAVAAVVVALLAVGVAVLARDDSGSSPTAARAPKATESPSSPAAAPNIAPDESSLNQSLRDAAQIQTLGNLGDVGKQSQLRRAVADVLSSKEPSADGAQSAAGATNAAPLAGSDCAAAELARLGRTIAVGTGTVDGAPVTVYVVERSNGDRVAVLVDAECTVGSSVGL